MDHTKFDVRNRKSVKPAARPGKKNKISRKSKTVVTSVALNWPIVIVKKLDEDVFGFAYPDTREIEIDPRQSSKEFLNTLIHECSHIWFPDLTESQVEKVAEMLTELIWHARFRRIQR